MRIVARPSRLGKNPPANHQVFIKLHQLFYSKTKTRRWQFPFRMRLKRHSISIWKMVSTHWVAALSWPCRRREASPLPPALRLRSHRFDSALKARSASTMEGLWKTHYVPGGFSNVNLHALPAVAHSPTIYPRMEGSLVGSSAGESLRLFFTLLIQGHLPYTSTLMQQLPSRGNRSSITPLAAPDTVEKGTDDSQDPA